MQGLLLYILLLFYGIVSPTGLYASIMGIVTSCSRDSVESTNIQTTSRVCARVVALITKQYLQISLVTRMQTCQNSDHEQRRPGIFSECKRISPPAAGALLSSTRHLSGRNGVDWNPAPGQSGREGAGGTKRFGADLNAGDNRIRLHRRCTELRFRFSNRAKEISACPAVNCLM